MAQHCPKNLPRFNASSTGTFTFTPCPAIQTIHISLLDPSTFSPSFPPTLSLFIIFNFNKINEKRSRNHLLTASACFGRTPSAVFIGEKRRRTRSHHLRCLIAGRCSCDWANSWIKDNAAARLFRTAALAILAKLAPMAKRVTSRSSTGQSVMMMMMIGLVMLWR